MTPRQVVEEWVRRFNAADADGLAELYHADAVNHQVTQEPVEGREAIRAIFAREFANAEMTCIPEVIHEAGEVAILEWKDPLGLRGCGFFTIRDGLIVFQRGYWDKLSFLRMHGLPVGPDYQWVQPYGMKESEFKETLLQAFPSLEAEMEDWEGLVHLQASAFARFTQEAITRGDEPLMQRCFELADRCLGVAESSLENALYVSYLEHLDLGGTPGERARSLMSPRLVQAWEDIMVYLRRLDEGSDRIQ